MKKGKIVLGSSLIIGTLALTKASFYLYDFSVKRNKKAFLENLQDNSNDSEEIKQQYIRNRDWFNNQNNEVLEIESQDGLKLKAYYIKAKKDTAKTVIIAHGYSDKAKNMSEYAQFFCEKLGFNVLMPDARGHGDSEGDYIGFGWKERKDYIKWIEKIININGIESQILLFGVSMGGATVMMTSGEELPEQVKVIVEDCGYSSVYDELKHQLKSMFNLPSFPFLYTTDLVVRAKAGYSVFDASCINQVRKSKTPTLFIHGENDTFVPVEMVYKLYEECSADKELLIIDDALHGNSYQTNKKLYEEKIEQFIQMYIK